jgi:hypothetical protein
MKRKRLPMDFNIPKVYLLFYLVVVSFYFSGCATSSASLDESDADRKASLELNCRNYWKIQKVLSATRNKDGGISICVRLVSPVTTESPKLKSITLSLSDLDGEISAATSNQFRTFECPLDYDWYPIDKTQKGCDEIGSNKTPISIALPIEKLDVGPMFDIGYKDRNRLFELLNTYTKDQQTKEKIYEVRSKSSKYVLLVYWPIQNTRQGIQPIVIAGVAERGTADFNFMLLLVTPFFFFF